MPHKLFVKGKNASTHKCPFGKFNKRTWVAVPETQTFRHKVFFCRNVCVCRCFWSCTFLGDLFWECLLFSYVISHKLFVPLWKTVPVHHNTLLEEDTTGDQQEINRRTTGGVTHTVWLSCLSKRRSGPGGRALPHRPLLCADLRVPLNADVRGSFSSLLFQNTLHHTLTIHSKHAKRHKSQLYLWSRSLSLSLLSLSLPSLPQLPPLPQEQMMCVAIQFCDWLTWCIFQPIGKGVSFCVFVFLPASNMD